MTPERSYFEVYAVRYATREARSGEHFYGHDPHDVPMPMDYFVWAAVSADHTAAVAERRALLPPRSARRPHAHGLLRLGGCVRRPYPCDRRRVQHRGGRPAG